MREVATLPVAAPARVLACGAWLKNRACLIDGDRVHWSANHGDLYGTEARGALDASVDWLLLQASGPVEAIAHDLHPDFHSTDVALALADRLGVPAIGVQHHHAHIGVVQAEQAPDGLVIGLALDGFGLGIDGAPWGGEVLCVDDRRTAHRWHRVDHLAPIALPGGDVAAREPWRMAAAALHGLGRADEIETRFGPVIGEEAARIVRSVLDRRLNCTLTTSAGRWFDAAAGALGIAVRQRDEAQAAIALETLASAFLDANPAFEVEAPSLDLAPVVGALFALAAQGDDAVARGAAMFHLVLVAALADAAIRAAGEYRTKTVALAGGCFHNRVLKRRLTDRLQAAGLTVLRPRTVDCGDAGIALGQAWIAACTVHADRTTED